MRLQLYEQKIFNQVLDSEYELRDWNPAGDKNATVFTENLCNSDSCCIPLIWKQGENAQ